MRRWSSEASCFGSGFRDAGSDVRSVTYSSILRYDKFWTGNECEHTAGLSRAGDFRSSKI